MVNFVNSFLSYLMVALIVVVVTGTATAIGITMAKKKSTGEEPVADQGGNE